jgi:putative ABC transport system permease protein
MIRNYLIVAWRNLMRYKGFTFINFSGLTLGIAACLLIVLYVWDELSFDRFHKDGDKIYRIYIESTSPTNTSNVASVPPMFSTSLKDKFPEVKAVTKFMNIYDQLLINSGKVKAYEPGAIAAEANFFDIFSLPFIEGNAASALRNPDALVLSEELAKKYFPGEPALGKILYVGNDTLQVTGVMKKLPAHFHLNLSYIVSVQPIVKQVGPERMQSWFWQQFYTYVKLDNNASADRLEAKFGEFIKTTAHPITKVRGFTYMPHFQQLKDIHLTSADFRHDMIRGGNIVYVKALAVIALFIILIACFNFINLSTARSLRRAKEVGIRKVAGAGKKQLLFQFTAESVLLTLMATVAAALVALYFLPALNRFTDKEIVFQPWRNFAQLGILLGSGILIGALAGFYPAFFIARFKPVEVVKGLKVTGGNSIQLLRKGLVVIQFTLAVFMIVSTLIVYRQVKYMQEKDLGFDKEQLMFFPMRGDNMFQSYQSFKNELLTVPGVTSATIGYGLPGDIGAGDEIIVPDSAGGTAIGARHFMVDYDFIKTMGLQVIAGRAFSQSMSTDKEKAFIINETAVKELGFGTPEKAIGRRLHWNKWDPDGGDSIKRGEVIGVVKDFHYSSLHEKVTRAVLQIYPFANYKVAMKIKSADMNGTVAGIEKVWSRFSPDYPLTYQFLDENFDKMYRAERNLSTLLWLFTAIAIFIGCLGLIGLAAYAAEQRIKEIGIRKVLGASVPGLVLLLSRDFVKLIVISICIAFPLVWWSMSNWLADFAYRIDIGWQVFVIAAISVLLIALFTISYQAIRAALTNPVKSLRTE